MLSVTIIALLTGMSMPVYESFSRRNDLDLTAQQVATALRRAETYARSANRDSAWSVEVQPTVITVFQGTTFASRTAAYDETVPIPGSITVSGLSEIQFAKLTAQPNTTGSITLTSNTNTTRAVTVNAKGMVQY